MISKGHFFFPGSLRAEHRKRTRPGVKLNSPPRSRDLARKRKNGLAVGGSMDLWFAVNPP